MRVVSSLCLTTPPECCLPQLECGLRRMPLGWLAFPAFPVSVMVERRTEAGMDMRFCAGRRREESGWVLGEEAPPRKEGMLVVQLRGMHRSVEQP